MSKTNEEYWSERFLALEEQNHQAAQRTVSDIDDAFKKAEAEIQKEINAWYRRFAENNEISFAQAKQLLTKRELQELRWDIEDYIKYGRENAFNQKWMKELENASAKYHISRLESLLIRTQQAAEKAFGNELDIMDKMAAARYTESYYHTAYEIQKGLGVAWDIGRIDEQRLKKILSKPWIADGLTFSDRIWKDQQQLISTVHAELTRMCILGGKPDAAIENIAHKMQVSKRQAGRLVMTESAYFGNKAQHDCFKELDVEEYEIVATLDAQTSEICQEMDGKHFPMKDYQTGVTAPPFHPWCRSVTCPFFDDEFTEGETRAARGEDGKIYQVPGNISYSEWWDKFVVHEVKEKTPLDFMGEVKKVTYKNLKNENITRKVHEVAGHEKMFSQTNTRDAQNTIEIIEKEKENIPLLKTVDEFVIAKDLPGAAAYDYETKRLYVNERLSNADYVKESVANGYFVAENAEETLRHEMHHKEHHDLIDKKALTSHKDRDILKQEIEADLRSYIVNQMNSNHNYLTIEVSRNAFVKFGDINDPNNQLNELIAEVLLQRDKGTVKDLYLLEKVGEIFK